MHAQGIRVILWATSLVNEDCATFQEGKAKGYFLSNGQTVKWWHGHGAFLDFSVKAAREWWFRQMDTVLDMGFDGWKCDGSDPLIVLLKLPFSSRSKRPIGVHEYGHDYYGYMYNYTKSRNPDALIMSRPVDSYQNKLFLAYSPKYVMFAGWVGDQDSTSAGFEEAMINVIHSASKGYLSFGFDIGGYRGQNISKTVYLRWVQAGSLMPFMENGGNGKHQPWKFDAETVQIYKKFTLLHYDLKQFFLTAGTEAYAQGLSIIQPLVADAKWLEQSHSNNLGYVLWNTFLVYPIFTEQGQTLVQFPKHSAWVYYFDHTLTYPGGSTLLKEFALTETPLFIKANSVFVLAGELHLVYLRPGHYHRTIIAGEYSDEVTLELAVGGRLSILVTRFYKPLYSGPILNELPVRLIGATAASSSQTVIAVNSAVTLWGVSFGLIEAG